MMNKEKVILLAPALWSSLFDITLTIIHQPVEYWEGNLTKSNEGNPIGAFFMSQHITGLFVISGLWLVAISFLGYYLPLRIRKIFLLFCVIAHSYGASTWLFRQYGFWSVLVFILLNSILFYVAEGLAKKHQA